MIKIYHGSKEIIEKPIYGFGKTYNDYGIGFYCTYELDMAKEWGVSLNQDGYANCYEMDCSDLKILDLNDSKYCILHWLAILLDNREFDIPSPLAVEAKEYILRNFSVNYEEYDVIVGNRADDSYFSFAQDFLNGTISYRQLSHAMHLGKLGQQFVLKSKKAFERISYIGYEKAKYDDWYARKMIRDRNARYAYLNEERFKRQRGDIFILNIIDEEMESDDQRLR